MLRTAALSVAIVGLLGSGCSNDGDRPRVLPTLGGSASPTSVPVVVPLEARAKTPQGADAFVRFFFKQMNLAFASSDPALIRSLTNGQCATCENYAKALEESRSKGHFVKGDSFLVLDVAAAPLHALGTLVEVVGRLPATSEVDAAGKELRKLPADGDFHFTFAVKRTASGWSVSGIKLGVT